MRCWLAFLVLAAGGPAAAQIPSLRELDARLPRWRLVSGVALGAVFTPGEVGRDRNATGGEELIASWGDGPALGFRLGFESRFGGAELTALQSGTAVRVKNEFGVAFPHHGKRPFAWTGGLILFPFAPIQPRYPSVRPFLTGGLGGVFLSVDLDNIRNQTLYHSFHWSIGGGLRIETAPENVPTTTSTFIELRLARFRWWSNEPLQAFGAEVVTAGVGMRF